jgi:hypothetical protein
MGLQEEIGGDKKKKTLFIKKNDSKLPKSREN